MDTESSGIDSPDNMNSSSEEMILSPAESRLTKSSVQRRKLCFLDLSPEHGAHKAPDEIMQFNLMVSPKKATSFSPPCRGVRQLR